MKKKYFNTNPLNDKMGLTKNIGGALVKEIFCYINFDNYQKDRYVISSFGRMFDMSIGKELKSKAKAGTTDRVVYLYTNDNKHEKQTVRRLVAKAFVLRTARDIELKKDCVHVIDKRRSSGVAANLIWVSRRDINIMNSIKAMGKCDHKLDYIPFICQLFSVGYTNEEILEIIPIKTIFAKSFLTKLRNRTIHKDLTKKYNF